MSFVLSKAELHVLWCMAVEGGLNLSDLDSRCAQNGLSVVDLLNELSIVLAKQFIDGALSFEFCDQAMNGIFGLIVELAMEASTPEPAFSIYQAFDGGEYIRPEDAPNIVPWDKYTRPALLEILRNR